MESFCSSWKESREVEKLSLIFKNWKSDLIYQIYIRFASVHWIYRFTPTQSGYWIVGKINIDRISTHTIREEISCWIWIWSLNFNSAHAFRWNSTLKICNLMIGILHILVECMHPYRKTFGPWIKNSEAFAIFRASTILELVISNHQVYGYISSKNSTSDTKKFKIFESAHANFLRKDFL